MYKNHVDLYNYTILFTNARIYMHIYIIMKYPLK